MSQIQTSVGISSDFIKALYVAVSKEDLSSIDPQERKPSETEQLETSIGILVSKIKKSFSTLSREEIEDVLLTKLPVIATRYRGVTPAELRQFVYRVVKNACTDEVRKPKSNLLSLDADGNQHLHPQTELEEINPDVVALNKAIERLPDNFKTVVRLCDIEDFSVREAAETLGISQPAVKSRLFRGREQLQRLLQGKIIEASNPEQIISGNSSNHKSEIKIDPIYAQAIQAWRLFNRLGISDKNIADFLRSVRDLAKHPINKSLNLIPLPPTFIRIKKPTLLSKDPKTVNQVPEIFLRSLISIAQSLQHGNLTIIGKYNKIAPNTSALAHLDECVKSGKKRAGNFRRSYQRISNPHEIVKILFKRQIPIKDAFAGYVLWRKNESKIDSYCGTELKLMRRSNFVTPQEIYNYIITGSITHAHLYGVFKFSDFIRKIERRELLYYHPDKKFYTPEELKKLYPFRSKFSAIFLRLGPSRLEQLRHLNAERLRSKPGEGIQVEPKEKYLARMAPILRSLFNQGYVVDTMPQALIDKSIPNQYGIVDWSPDGVARTILRLNRAGVNPASSIRVEVKPEEAQVIKDPVAYEKIRKQATIEMDPRDFFQAMYRVRNGYPKDIVDMANFLFDELTHWIPLRGKHTFYRTVICKRPITFNWKVNRLNPSAHFNQGDMIILHNMHGDLVWDVRDPRAVLLLLEKMEYKKDIWYGFQSEKET